MERIYCKECGRAFILTDGEIAFYKGKGLELPKRCNICRQKRKAERSGKEYIKQDNYIPGTNRKKKTSFRLALYVILAVVIICAVIGSNLVNSRNDTLWGHAGTGDYGTYESNASYKTDVQSLSAYTFRNSELRQEHYQKHGAEMGFSSAAEYEAAASAVVTNSASRHKLEAEDGDDVYYLDSTNEFVIVSTDGYIRTYFKPDNGSAYFEKQ